jgi:hypothetical protein
MDQRAIIKARIRLNIAAEAADTIRLCTEYDKFVGTWYTFITSSKNIWTTLEQGSKDNPQCRQWFGAKERERRTDELLQYLFEARNDDEHGLEAITEHVQGSTKIGVSKPGFSNSIYIRKLSIGPTGIEFDGHSLDGKPILMEQTLPHFRLSEIRPRGRPLMQPPSSHKGIILTDISPVAVADLALSYFRALVEEAALRTN